MASASGGSVGSPDGRGVTVGRLLVFSVTATIDAGVCVGFVGAELALAFVVGGIEVAAGREVGGSDVGRGAAKIASNATIINAPPRLNNNKRRELFINNSS